MMNGLILIETQKTILELLMKNLQAIALQTGSEVSYHEIGQLVGADSQTVERYISLLEQTFVIFRLPAFSRNMRNEIKKVERFISMIPV